MDNKLTWLALMFVLFFLSPITGTDSVFRAYRLIPKSDEQLSYVLDVYDSATELKLDFWTEPSGQIGEAVDVMVPPSTSDRFNNWLSDSNVSYELLIDDVKQLVNHLEGSVADEAKSAEIPAATSSWQRVLHDDAGGKLKTQLNLAEYHSYSAISSFMRLIEFYYPKIARLFQSGTTNEGQKIMGLKIGNLSNADAKKKAIWIDGGIHAREWASINTALYFIGELVRNYGIDDNITLYVDSLTFYIVPCMNPDGYDYSHTITGDPLSFRRMWRKNRSRQICNPEPNGKYRCCQGVDLNRNFDFHWSGNGSSEDPCSETFKGMRAFSEPESRALRDMLQSPELKGKTEAYITMHTYKQLWMYPYGLKKNMYSTDVEDLKAVAEEAIKALEQVSGTKYKTGTSADILYPVSGSSLDWVKDVLKIKYTYLLELRPSAKARTGFILQKSELIPTATETWAGVRVVIDAVLKRSGFIKKTEKSSKIPKESKTEDIKNKRSHPITAFENAKTSNGTAREARLESSDEELPKICRYGFRFLACKRGDQKIVHGR